MINRTIILICLIILIAGVTNWILEESATEPVTPVPADNEPDLYMTDALITTYDETGSIQYKIRASRFTHFPVNDVTTLKDPNLDLFSEKGPWNIAARNGRLLPATTHEEELVELWEHVVAVRETRNGEFTNIQTEGLTVFPDRDYAETDQKVDIDDPSGRTSAAAMQAWFKPGRFLFFSGPGQRVNTILLPESLDTDKEPAGDARP